MTNLEKAMDTTRSPKATQMPPWQETNNRLPKMNIPRPKICKHLRRWTTLTTLSCKMTIWD